MSDLLNIGAVAVELGVTRSTIRRIAFLRGFGVKIGRNCIFTRDEVEQMRNRKRPKPLYTLNKESRKGTFSSGNAAIQLGISRQAVRDVAIRLGVGIKIGRNYALTLADIEMIRNRKALKSAARLCGRGKAP